ncbi:MAG: hypothetical protein Q4B36_05060, partial [Tissierellia bacterium]|nr:hypothetical protein [Tissierellia bacterium]
DSYTDTSINQVIDEWNRLDKNIPRIQTLNANSKRYTMLKARIDEHGLENVIKAIRSIDNSKFLKGYVSDFKITFDWFVKPNNFIKVLEGNYIDKKPVNSKKHSVYHSGDYGQKANLIDGMTDEQWQAHLQKIYKEEGLL